MATRAQKAELDKESGRLLSVNMVESGVAKASEDDVALLSQIFNRELAKKPPTCDERKDSNRHRSQPPQLKTNDPLFRLTPAGSWLLPS